MPNNRLASCEGAMQPIVAQDWEDMRTVVSKYLGGDYEVVTLDEKRGIKACYRCSGEGPATDIFYGPNGEVQGKGKLVFWSQDGMTEDLLTDIEYWRNRPYQPITLTGVLVKDNGELEQVEYVPTPEGIKGVLGTQRSTPSWWLANINGKSIRIWFTSGADSAPVNDSYIPSDDSDVTSCDDFEGYHGPLLFVLHEDTDGDGARIDLTFEYFLKLASWRKKQR